MIAAMVRDGRRSRRTGAAFAAMLLAAVLAILGGCDGLQVGAREGDPAAALDVARLLVPEDQIADQAAAMHRLTMDAQAASPEGQALEREHPGLQIAVREAGAAVMQRVVKRDLPDMQSDVADAAAGLATTEQLREIVRFLRSDAARAMQREARKAFADNARTLLRAGETGATSERAGDAMLGARDAAIRSLTPEQAAEIDAFDRTPAGQALSRIAPVATRIILSRSAAIDSEARPEIEEAVDKVVEQRIGR